MEKRDFYRMGLDELYESTGGSGEGLSSGEAARILEEKGPNVLSEEKKKSAFMVFLGQFADLLVIILIVAAVISMVSGNVESTIVIFAVIIMNAVLGTVQYIKAEKSLALFIVK